MDDRRVEIQVEDDRTGMEPVTMERAVLDHLYYSCGKDTISATPLDLYHAMAFAVRDRLIHRWIITQRRYYSEDVKRVYYLSAEFLIGRLLGHNLMNMDIYDVSKEMLAQHGYDLAEILEHELDPGLGNGGLGRLAACFLDSMATLELPGYGYGIRYEFGIFKQEIKNGWQMERPDAWLRRGTPWEIPHHEHTVPVSFYGRVEQLVDDEGVLVNRWIDTQKVLAVPYDTPIAGYNNNPVNTLRLWSAQASNEFNLTVFNDGDYRRAVEEKAMSESISKVLYPKDNTFEGRELRLKQQYFFVCSSIHDIMRRFKATSSTFDSFPDKVALQLNDTHPSITVAELMRVLVDIEGLSWEKAWDITERTVAYTNHTLLSEALEKWPVPLFEKLLPRHLQIIFEINDRMLRQVHIHSPGDNAKKRRMSIIEEGEVQHVRMAHLAVAGSHSVNGVAELHSELIKTKLLPDFYEVWPQKFNNKTNGVTPRRWLLQCNPKLAAAITKRIGRKWIQDLYELRNLTQYADDPDFHQELNEIKAENKRVLAAIILQRHGLEVDVNSIFDVQIKRLHEYKRQLLNCLHIIALYRAVRLDPSLDMVPRTFIFGGKAAPGYANAKLHIKPINDVASIVNHDPLMRGRIKVVFLANYNVSLAEKIIPAADVSEQISMAGKEASGTGNMKFSMNGALTLGTLDGANIEIREEVGADNFFLFGLTAAEVGDLKAKGYDPAVYIAKSPILAGALQLIEDGVFGHDDPTRFHSVTHHLRKHDEYLLCADFDDYVQKQKDLAAVYRHPELWLNKVVHNLANMGKFSSDRAIREYASELWDVHPIHIELRKV